MNFSPGFSQRWNQKLRPGGREFQKAGHRGHGLRASVGAEMLPSAKGRRAREFLAIVGRQVCSSLPEAIPTVEHFDALLDRHAIAEADGTKRHQIFARPTLSCER